MLIDPYGAVQHFVEALDEVSEDMVHHPSKLSFLSCVPELMDLFEYDTLQWFVRKHPQNLCSCLCVPVVETCWIKKELF